MSDAEIFKLRHVFQHARESCKGELLSVEAFGVAMAVDEVALKLAVEVDGARVGEFGFSFLCLFLRRSQYPGTNIPETQRGLRRRIHTSWRRIVSPFFSL